MVYGGAYPAQLAAARAYVLENRSPVYLQAPRPVIYHGAPQPAVVEVRPGRFWGTRVMQPVPNGTINHQHFTRRLR